MVKSRLAFTDMGKSRPYHALLTSQICLFRGGGGGKGEVGLTKYLCVFIHIWIKGEVGAVKPVKALQ